jgi:hypothetical protein
MLGEVPSLLELEGRDVDPIAERVRAVEVACESLHVPAGLQ